MFLKSLSIRGFKTFADKVDVEFDSPFGITAIVGPNGCGKSNLLDATRWVLGEENPRELRVASLSDIIFSGSLKRKALSMAEVSLIFDNTDGRLTLPFSEIAIRRRTFRESESEFSVNKNNCRLKDIHDLLFDTGLGGNSYSIITQGQVDAILSSKGEERRALFEEAAGINKYKSRKMIAERRLIAAEQNILRINDLKIEVGEQLITLEEQAKKAREYQNLQTQTRELDLGLSKRLLQNLSERRQVVIEKLQEIKQQFQEASLEEEKEEKTILDLKNRLLEVEAGIEEIHLKLDREKDRLRDVELERRFKESEVQRAQKENETLRQKINALEEKERTLVEEFEKIKNLQATYDFNLLQEELSAALNSTILLLKSLNQLLLNCGGSKDMLFKVDGSNEKESALKFKKELLQEERLRLAENLKQVEFSLAAQNDELKNLALQGSAGGQKEILLEKDAKLRQEKISLGQEINSLEEKRSRHERKDRSSKDIQIDLEVSLAKIDTEIKGIEEKLQTEYNLSIEEALQFTYEIEGVAKAKSLLDENRHRLRMLEPVNLLAIEEYERTKERQSFVETQLSDLNSAHDNLKMLISELDQKAKETFLETMQKISEAFSTIFSRLFNGGEARISLADPERPLEGEIDISVRLAQRKWVALPLLSGGERALCAIAILFSLLKIRPSPFCFLDEVDAPLDEANIGRFTSMLKEFSQKTQMIVITHNKNTMAVADTIYGVTMEEPGVSKIISMKLNKVAA